MRPSLKTLFHYRPRFLTLVAFAAVAAMLVLANLSDEVRVRRMPTPPPTSATSEAELLAGLVFDTREPPDDDPSFNGAFNLSYGWPLLWRQYVVGVAFQVGVASSVYGELRSTGRLAANVMMSLMMLAAPTIVCEWLLRRYRPRFRWSLRTMLIVVGLVAAGCGWYFSARNRIKIETPLIAAIERAGGHVWVDHYGPDWLDLLGADDLRRRIVGAYLGGRHHDKEIEELLEQLGRLPKLQYLFVNVDQWTSRMTAALRQMRRLRALSIEGDTPITSDDTLKDILVNKPDLWALSIDLRHSADSPAQTSRELLMAIGKVTQLESLRLVHATIPINSLSHLGGLAELKSFTLEDVSHDRNGPIGPPSMFAHLPVLPRLEAVSLPESAVGDGDLHQLRRLPCLKLLNLTGTYVTRAGVAKLATLKSLEELAIDEEVVSAEGLMELQKLNRLRSLHINGFSGQCGPEDELKREQLADMPESSFAALKALRRSKADLVIDGYQGSRDWDVRVSAPLRYASLDRGLAQYVRKALRQWKEEQAEKQAASAPD